MSNTNSNWIVTLILVAAFIVLRILGEVAAYTSVVVALINSCSLLYVLYVIDKGITGSLYKRDRNIKMFRIQEEKYKKTRRRIIFFFIIFMIVYLISLHHCSFVKDRSSFVNDVIAILAFGMSIEDTFIQNKIYCYYAHLTC